MRWILTWRDMKLKGLADRECERLDKLGDWALEERSWLFGAAVLIVHASRRACDE